MTFAHVIACLTPGRRAARRRLDATARPAFRGGAPEPRAEAVAQLPLETTARMNGSTHGMSLLAIGPRSGGVGAVFTGTVAALRERVGSIDERRPVEEGSAAVAAVRCLWGCRRSVRGANIAHVEFGSNDIAVFWCAWLLTLLRRDVVAVIHDPAPVAHSPGAGLIARRGIWHRRVAYLLLAPLLGPRLKKRILLRSGAIVVLGRPARDALQTVTPVPVRYAPHGLDLAPSAAPAPSLCDYVLFAGYIGPNKGLDTLIEAWSALSLPLRLVIAGAADRDFEGWVSELRERSQTFANPPEWRGYVRDEGEFTRLFEHAAIVVMPYRSSSPASGILVRAMAAGRCVIATPVPAAEALIEDRREGCILEGENPAVLARALEELAAAPAERDRLGHAAAQRVREELGWERQVNALFDTYALVGDHRDDILARVHSLPAPPVAPDQRRDRSAHQG